MSQDVPATDECGYLGGRLTLRQFCRGHRAGTDAVLLAAAAKIRPGQHLVDAGAGVGAAALAVLSRVSGITATLVERDSATAELAAVNLEANDFAGQAAVLQADIFDKDACRPVWTAGADVIVSNPPYYHAGSVRASIDPGRRAAHVGERPLDEWLTRLLACLRPKGQLVVIHRPETLPQILGAVGRRLGAQEVRPIYAKAGGQALRIVFTGIAGSRAPFRLAPALTLHAEDGTFTPAAQAIHAEATALV